MNEKKCKCSEEPLLVITQQDVHSVPEVYYKGEKINYKREISFNWETSPDILEGHADGAFEVEIEYFDIEERAIIKKGHKSPFY